jgi:enoyl-CoA hydratase
VPVTYEVQDHVAVVTFDDGKANVYTHEALEALTAALARAEADPAAGAVLLVGREGRFSAGFDLATMTASDESMQGLVKAGGQFVARLLLHPMPVVAACNGHALAAGALVLLAADHRIGSDGPWKIGLNEVSIGMALPVWAVELARCRLASAAFEWSVILGQVSNPNQAKEAGFLDRVVAPDELPTEALKTASALAGLRRGAVAGTKTRARDQLVRRMLTGIDQDLAQMSGPTPAPATTGLAAV